MDNLIPLPQPFFKGGVSVEEALLRRRSVRSLSPSPIGLNELAQLLWSAQGITHPDGFRTSPSAGALYPLEVYAVCYSVSGLEMGVYHYSPFYHSLTVKALGDFRKDMVSYALGQEWSGSGAVCFVINAVYERTTAKYGERGIRYADMEGGHSAQNLLLQATALGLAGVPIGAFYDNQIRKLVKAGSKEYPLYLIPIGRVL